MSRALALFFFAFSALFVTETAAQIYDCSINLESSDTTYNFGLGKDILVTDGDETFYVNLCGSSSICPQGVSVCDSKGTSYGDTNYNYSELREGDDAGIQVTVKNGAQCTENPDLKLQAIVQARCGPKTALITRGNCEVIIGVQRPELCNGYLKDAGFTAQRPIAIAAITLLLLLIAL